VTIDLEDPRDRPIRVRFDSGEVHHYSLQAAAAKLEQAEQTQESSSGKNRKEQNEASKLVSESTSCARPPILGVLCASVTRKNETHWHHLPDAAKLSLLWALRPERDALWDERSHGLMLWL
jgi:hypothetical protein